jgi:hypothetical protein
MIKAKKEKDLRDLAEDIYKGSVFTNRHIGEMEMLTTIFMPLGFMKKKDLSNLKGAGMIFEYLEKALPRSINGYPMFMSFNCLNRKDTVKVWNYYKEIKEVLNKLKEGKVK